ncbi:MAG: permease [Bdellovibrionales bacterium]|nr:permease [Bdellovibrionales bacterium]
MDFLNLYAESAKTAIGFFWKAGWAFVFGYFISAMIQAFVPKSKLTPYMGGANFKSIRLSTLFGAASSSCSFAALATARSLFKKGAHFIATVAFMFASTNLVIELGVLIVIFLGWQFLVAEIIGGLLLIAISSILIKILYPKKWIKNAREKIEDESTQEESFDWKKRIKSKQGWYLVGNKFVSDWKMVWQEILIGFSIAGIVAVVVPTQFWESMFLMHVEAPEWMIVLENALVAPFVAAATFIGSMGNIPLATVLSSNGVLFAGIMGFIYSDLMVPPLIKVNAKYYGKKIAFFIAGIMYVSIVITALLMHYGFLFFDMTPDSQRKVSDATQFAFDYTFYLNLSFLFLAVFLVFLNKKHKSKGHSHHHGGSTLKKIISYSFIFFIVSGGLIYVFI